MSWLVWYAIFDKRTNHCIGAYRWNRTTELLLPKQADFHYPIYASFFVQQPPLISSDTDLTFGKVYVNEQSTKRKEINHGGAITVVGFKGLGEKMKKTYI